MHHRNEGGSHTNFVWIHSHVDDPNRLRWNNKWLRPCGCGGITIQDHKECDPEHKHHLGNALADELATEALGLPTSGDDLDDPMCGEEDYSPMALIRVPRGGGGPQILKSQQPEGV